MKKILLSATALTALSVSALAADLPARGAPVMQPVGVSSFDAFGSLAAGYNWGAISAPGVTLNTDGLNLGARATFAAPISGNFGFQADGQYERSAYTLQNLNLTKNTGDLAGHVFWRDSSVGLLGVIAQASTTETSLGFVSDRRYFLGAEGQYFINNVTLYGQIAYENVNFGFPALSGNGVSGDGLIVAGQLRYFVSANLMLALKGSYETVSTSDLGNDLRHTGWLIGAKTEYRLNDSPISAFAEIDYRGGKFNVADVKDHETRLMVGAKFNFGSKTLFERDRSGASLDPLRSLKAVVPAVID